MNAASLKWHTTVDEIKDRSGLLFALIREIRVNHFPH